MAKVMLNKLNIYGTYIVITACTVSLLVLLYDVGFRSMRVPYEYSWDSVFCQSIIKTIIETGWIIYNPRVGAPLGLEMGDFPMGDGLAFLLIRFLALFSKDSGLVLNCFFLVMFIVCALTSTYVLNAMKFSKALVVLGSLLFTFLPYHWIRGQSHLFLSAYYIVPCIVLLCFRCFENSGACLCIDNNSSASEKALYILKPSIIVLCICIGSSGIYYAFFACFFIMFTGMYLGIANSDKYIAFRALICISLVVIALGINILPNILYVSSHGINSEVAHRLPLEAEYYGMKIARLFIPPFRNHAIPIVNEVSNRYSSFPLNGGEWSEYLGIFGSIGFLVLLYTVFFSQKVTDTLIRSISLLNLAAILLATIGGFASFFALFVSAQIRCYNRISVFIGFFSIVGLLYLLGELQHRFRFSRLIFYGFTMIITVFGIVDQFPLFQFRNSRLLPTYVNYVADRNYFQAIESRLPANSMIFQFPYMPFPESQPINKILDYDLLKGYLHTNTLRWSYAGMKGRDADRWQRVLVSQGISHIERIQRIAAIGFCGILIDRYGYSDNGEMLINEIQAILATYPIVDGNNRYAFFSLDKILDTMKQQFGPKTIEDLKRSTLYPGILEH
jgi:hypothetical protein